jgi:hypothetical protein
MPVDTEILYPALRLAGVLTAAGRGASSSQLADAFASLNRMIDAWTIQRLLIYTIRADRYNLSPSQITYTIGPGGNFDATRPVRITAANIVLLGSTETRVPLRLLTDRDWAAKRLQVVPTTVPTELYNDGAFPVSTLFLWGYPTAANDLELFTWSQLTPFGAATDPVVLAPGYEDAVVYNLAVRLCGQFGTQLRGDVAQIARESKGLVKSYNSISPRISSTDIGTGANRGGGFNYLTGGLK